MKTLVKGGYIVGFNGNTHEILKDGSVVIEDDTISFVGFDYPGSVDRTLNATGKLVCPGFVNSHMHANSNAGEYFLNDHGKTVRHGGMAVFSQMVDG